MGDLDCMTRRLAAASVAAGLALFMAPAGASAFPVLDPDAPALEAPTPVATASAKRKKINRKVQVAGSFRVLPGSTFGTPSMTPDGVGHLTGARVVGRLSAKLVGSKRSRRGLKGLSRLLTMNVRGKLNIDSYFDPQIGNPMIARGLIAGRATRSKRATGCLKLSSTTKDGKPFQRFRVVGGTGKLAGLTLSGKLPTVSLDRPNAEAPSSLTLRLKSAKKKKPPKSCRKLLKR